MFHTAGGKGGIDGSYLHPGQRSEAVTDYLLLYMGDGKMPEPEEMPAFMDSWAEWMKAVGTALKDPGLPFHPAAKTIVPSGAVSDSSVVSSGYSVITADSLADAVEMSKSSPVLGTGTSINIFESYEMDQS